MIGVHDNPVDPSAIVGHVRSRLPPRADAGHRGVVVRVDEPHPVRQGVAVSPILILEQLVLDVDEGIGGLVQAGPLLIVPVTVDAEYIAGGQKVLGHVSEPLPDHIEAPKRVGDSRIYQCTCHVVLLMNK